MTIITPPGELDPLESFRRLSDILKVEEVARVLRIHESTVRQRIADGFLQGFNVSPGGGTGTVIRITREALINFVSEEELDVFVSFRNLPAVLTVDEVAAFLRVGTETILKRIEAGSLASFTSSPGGGSGARLRVTREALLNFVRSGPAVRQRKKDDEAKSDRGEKD